MKMAAILLFCFISVVSLAGQNVPHTLMFKLLHEDGQDAHRWEHLGIKVVNITGIDNRDSICYNMPLSETAAVRALNYDEESGLLLIQLSFLERYLPRDSLKVNFRGDGGSWYEKIIERSKSSVTRGGEIKFGRAAH